MGTCEEDDGAGFGAFDAVHGRDDVEVLVGQGDVDAFFGGALRAGGVCHVDLGGWSLLFMAEGC